MMNNRFFFMWGIMSVLMSLCGNAHADLGPKPKVDIDLVYNQQKIPDASFSAKMLDCREQQRGQEEFESERDGAPQLKISIRDDAAQCYWQPAQLAWGGECSDSRCNFGYFPPSEFKLAVYIPSLDKVFVTGKISRENFHSRYRVELFADGTAKIAETTPLWETIRLPAFARALLITIFLELLVTWIFVTVRKLPRKKILAYVLLANIFSLPAVWFLFTLIDLPEIAVMVIYELFAVIFETYYIHYFCKPLLSFRQTLLLSILNNTVSLFIGGFLFMLLMFFVG